DQRPDGLSSSSSSGSTPLFSAVTSTTVFLTATELQYLRSSPVYRASRSQSTPKEVKRPRKSRLLSRTLSDTPTTDPSDPDPTHYPSTSGSSIFDELLFNPSPSFHTPGPLSPSPIKVAPETSHHTLSNGKLSHEVEEGVTGGNLSGRPGGAQDRSFVRATLLLHSHFSHTEALQEAIVRSV
uniref:Uncharacterized protein n=1 Tax=Hucho hucho TaxID=62062 RepID=A0A4W5MPC4_9TELE